MVFLWSLSDSKSPQVSRTLLSILADLNNAVVWTLSTRPVISKSSSPCTNPLVTAPRAPITIDIIVTFMFHSFFQFSSKVGIIIPLFAFGVVVIEKGAFGLPSTMVANFTFTYSLSFNFTLWAAGTQSTQSCKFSFFVDHYKIWSSG